jgi:hypothetical protein
MKDLLQSFDLSNKEISIPLASSTINETLMSDQKSKKPTPIQISVQGSNRFCDEK